MIQFQSILAALEMIMACVLPMVRESNGTGQPLEKIYAFDSLEILAHVVLAAKVTAFDNLECFEKWPLATKSEIWEFF